MVTVGSMYGEGLHWVLYGCRWSEGVTVGGR